MGYQGNEKRIERDLVTGTKYMPPRDGNGHVTWVLLSDWRAGRIPLSDWLSGSRC